MSRLFDIRADILIDEEQIDRCLSLRAWGRTPVQLPENEELVLKLLWKSRCALDAQGLAAASENRLPNPAYTRALAESLVQKGFVRKSRAGYSPRISRHDYQCLVEIVNKYVHEVDDPSCLGLLAHMI